MKQALTILFLLISVLLYADAEWYPELAKMYDCDAVVDASLHTENEEYFIIRINSVLRDPSQELRAGDLIKVRNTHSGACGFFFQIQYYPHARYYLEKVEGKWQMLQNADVGITIIRNDSAYCYFGTESYHMPNKEFNRYLVEFFACYEKYPDAWAWYPTVSDAALIKKSQYNPIIRDFEEAYRSIHELHHYWGDVLTVDSAGRGYLTSPQLTVPPKFKGRMQSTELLRYIQNNLSMQLNDKEKEQVVMVRLLIDAQGQMQAFTILQSPNARMEKAARNLVKKMDVWSPPVHFDKPVACTVTLPIYFNSRS